MLALTHLVRRQLRGPKRNTLVAARSLRTQISVSHIVLQLKDPGHLEEMADAATRAGATKSEMHVWSLSLFPAKNSKQPWNFLGDRLRGFSLLFMINPNCPNVCRTR